MSREASLYVSPSTGRTGWDAFVEDTGPIPAYLRLSDPPPSPNKFFSNAELDYLISLKTEPYKVFAWLRSIDRGPKQLVTFKSMLKKWEEYSDFSANGLTTTIGTAEIYRKVPIRREKPQKFSTKERIYLSNLPIKSKLIYQWLQSVGETRGTTFHRFRCMLYTWRSSEFPSYLECKEQIIGKIHIYIYTMNNEHCIMNIASI